MIDSFYRWSRQNPKRAKKLEDFIAEGLIAAAKRCKTCLSRELGVGFKEGKDVRDDSLDIAELSEPTGVPVFFEESSLDPTEPIVSPEIPPDFEAPPSSDSVIDEEFTEPDSETSHSEESPRDFSAEFELVEPEPLITKPEELEHDIPPESEITGPPTFEIYEELHDIPDSDTQEETIESTTEISPYIEEKPISEELETTKPRFSWDNQDEGVVTSDSSDSDIDTPEPEESSAKVRLWSPYDEPSISEPTTTSESDLESSEIEDIAEELEVEMSPSTAEEPPAPPPPPESDESEEERKRKARRLFFGT
jgi:hypothetical protein